MNNKLTLLLILFSFCNSLVAQEYIVKVRNSNSKRYTYININGENEIESDYFKCVDFSTYGRCIVLEYVSSEYSIINKKGDKIETDVSFVPMINEWVKTIYGFSYGMVRTKGDNKIGALNYNGELTVPTIYNKLTEFNGKHAIGLIGKTYYVVKNNGDKIALDFNKIKGHKRFSEGLAPIRLGKLFGYIDTLGQMIIEPKFQSVGYFNGGLAWAKNLNGLVGYIDKSGIWVIEPSYYIGDDYDKESKLARVKSKNGWGYVNTENQFESFGITNDFYNFYEGLAIKRIKDKVGYIDNTGSWVIEPIFDVAYKFKNGFARVLINKKWGIIDKKGKWLIEPKYNAIGDAVMIK